MHEVVHLALQRFRAELLDIAAIPIAGGLQCCIVRRLQIRPVHYQQVLRLKLPAALNAGQSTVQVVQNAFCQYRPCFLLYILPLAEKQLPAARRLRSQQIFHLSRKHLRHFGIDYRKNAADLKPPIQRRFIQGIKKLVHIKNAGRFYDDPIKVLHAQRNQLSFEPPLVAARITAAGNHFQLTVLALQVL